MEILVTYESEKCPVFVGNAFVAAGRQVVTAANEAR
jgi:hypothetical protein